MNCQKFVDSIIDYLEGTLTESEVRHFDQHLQRCPPCIRYFETYRLSIRIGKKACCCDSDESGQPLPEALIQSILTACRKPRPDS